VTSRQKEIHPAGRELAGLIRHTPVQGALLRARPTQRGSVLQWRPAAFDGVPGAAGRQARGCSKEV